MKKFSASTITGAALYVSVFTVITRSLGFLREIIFAGIFGLKPEFDLYLAAASIPFIVNTSVIYLAQNYFVPAYHSIPSPEHIGRINFLNLTLRKIFIPCLFAALILFLFKKYFIELYLWNSTENLKSSAAIIFGILVLSIPLNAVYAVLTSYLQAKSKFSHPAISNLFINLSIITLVILFNDVIGIYSIPSGYLMGNLLQASYLIVIARKDIKLQLIFGLKSKLNSGFVKVNLFLILLIEVIGQLYILADRYFFNFLNPGGIASLNYASNLFLLPVSVLSFSLATVIFPKFSEHYSRKEFSSLEYYFNKSLTSVIYLFTPLAFIFYKQGSFLVRLLFQRGEFRGTDYLITFEVLQYLSLSLIFYAAYSIVNKMFFSAGKVKYLVIISSGVLALKIVLNFILAGSMQQNGLALATSISYILFFILCYYVIYVPIKLQQGFIVYGEIIYFFCCALLSYFTADLFLGIFSLNGNTHSALLIILFPVVYFSIIRFLTQGTLGGHRHT